MEKIKNALKSVNKFGLLALVFVAFATLAFKAPSFTVQNSSSWTRVLNENEEFEWIEEDVPGLCIDADEICRADFPDNYDPSMHSDTENKLNAVNGEYTEGYVLTEQ